MAARPGGRWPTLRYRLHRYLRRGAGRSLHGRYQRLRAVGQLDDNEKEWAHRLSSYVIVAFNVSDVIKLGETFYFQPSLEGGQDVRLLSESEFLVTFKGRFALKTAFTLAYDSRPPMGIHGLDTGMKTSLQVSF